MPTFDNIIKKRDKTHIGVVKSRVDGGYVVSIGGVDRTIKSSVGVLAPGSNTVVMETPQGWLVVAPGSFTGRKTLEVDIDG